MNNIFDNIVELPNKGIQERAKNLVGFDSKFDRIFTYFYLILITISTVPYQYPQVYPNP